MTRQSTEWKDIMRRVLSAIFGALLFAILIPLTYWLTFESIPFDSFNGFLLLMGSGVALGGCLGALFPKPFGFIFEMFMEI